MYHRRTSSIEETASALAAKMSIEDQFPVVIESPTAAAFEVSTNLHETVEDLYRSIASALNTSDFRFADRFNLLSGSTVLRGDQEIKDCGLRRGSRLTIAPKVTTGLRSTPKTSQEVTRTLESMITQAAKSGDLDNGPVTLVASLGDKQIAIQISNAPSTENAAPQVSAPLSEQDRDRLARELLAKHIDEKKLADARQREHEKDNRKLKSKLEELRLKMKRRREHSNSDDPATKLPPTPHPNPIAVVVPDVRPTFGGLRRGFLLK